MRGREEDSEAGSPSSESPLRQALSSGCKGSSPSSSTTPILSASLSAPPMHTERSGLDLSRLGRSREEAEEEARKTGGLYKHLISQLTGPPKRPRVATGGGGSRFQCPVCRKRFQRHIALNAHFQSEHIGGGEEPGGKTCKICLARLPGDPSAMRLHLLSAHRIDLENPAACLINEGGRLSSPEDESSVGSSCSSISSSASSERLFLPEECSPREKDLRIVKKRRKASRILRSGEESLSPGPPWTCAHCSIIFPNQTLYFLHKGFHGELSDPFRCNGCGMACSDMYDFNTHLMSDPHH